MRSSTTFFKNPIPEEKITSTTFTRNKKTSDLEIATETLYKHHASNHALPELKPELNEMNVKLLASKNKALAEKYQELSSDVESHNTKINQINTEYAESLEAVRYLQLALGNEKNLQGHFSRNDYRSDYSEHLKQFKNLNYQLEKIQNLRETYACDFKILKQSVDMCENEIKAFALNFALSSQKAIEKEHKDNVTLQTNFSKLLNENSALKSQVKAQNSNQDLPPPYELDPPPYDEVTVSSDESNLPPAYTPSPSFRT